MYCFEHISAEKAFEIEDLYAAIDEEEEAMIELDTYNDESLSSLLNYNLDRFRVEGLNESEV